jgi:hypothetical protein
MRGGLNTPDTLAVANASPPAITLVAIVAAMPVMPAAPTIKAAAAVNIATYFLPE